MTGGFGRHHHHDPDHPFHRSRERLRGMRRGRVFDYGELRLLLLALIAEQPRHGYDLIKSLEERFGGAYSPSPGVIYPTLAWLDDMSYAAIEAEEGGRKRYRITAEGEAFLATNRAAADELLQRVSGGGASAPAPVIRAMENLRFALRLRFREGPVTREEADRLASAIDAATQAIERGA